MNTETYLVAKVYPYGTITLYQSLTKKGAEDMAKSYASSLDEDEFIVVMGPKGEITLTIKPLWEYSQILACPGQDTLWKN